MSKDLNNLISQSKKYYENINDLKTKMMGNGTEEENEKEEKEKEKSEKKNQNNDEKKEKNPSEESKENKQNSIKDPLAPTKESVEESIKNFTETKKIISEQEISKFSFNNFNNSTIFSDLPKPQKFKCLNYLVKSIYNQFLKDENKKGDLQYFEVSTLEGKIFYITSSEKGYFINNSTSTEFSNFPSNLPCFSYTLVGVLSQISPLFKDNFTKLISQSINIDPSFFSSSPSDKFEWIGVNLINNNEYAFRYKGFNYESENNRYSRLNKEWNEEFQAINDLNFNQDPIQNLSKEKLMQEFYKIFKETAIEGVKLIREKKICCFNFFDNPRTNSGYYMFGNIFFTVLEDSYNNFRVIRFFNFFLSI